MLWGRGYNHVTRNLYTRNVQKILCIFLCIARHCFFSSMLVQISVRERVDIVRLILILELEHLDLSLCVLATTKYMTILNIHCLQMLTRCF